MRLLRSLGAVAAVCCGLASAATYSPLDPTAIPLAVASPYVNTWLVGGKLPGTWPTFWAGQVTGWQAFISVDGAVYNWLGASLLTDSYVNQTAFSYTSTRSVFTLAVNGQVEMTVTFVTPVFPDDLVMKSLQASYVEVEVVSTDGGSHDTVIYMDITGEWNWGNLETNITWDTQNSDGVQMHRIWSPDQVIFGENNNQADWGTLFFATTDGSEMTYQIGSDNDVRQQFLDSGTLKNTIDTNYRAINDDWPVFAFSQDLGAVTADGSKAIFSVSLAQQDTIKFQGDELQELEAPWYSRWTDAIDANAYWLNNYDSMSTYATTIDQKVHSDASSVGGDNYAAITTLAVRQAFAALQPARGTQDYLFLKEISSNGDISTVDVMFPAFPMYYYFNATIIKLLLDPLFENQESGNYPNTYAIHDLGTFPNALGYPDGNDEKMPVEECANMIIMALSYAQKTKDTSYLSLHYSKMQQWVHYLIDDSLVPADQLSTDDFAGSLANQTNLALKGIIGIAAMGQVAQLTGNTDNYTSAAQSYIEQWYGYGINSAANPPHTILSYNNPGSWGLLYNIYSDKLLGLNLVNASVYSMQSTFYSSVMDKYGVPLDTRHTYTKLDWECWVASTSSDETRDAFYAAIFDWLGSGTTNVPQTDWYDAETGASAGGFKARPVVAGTFAQLALQL